MSESPLLEEHRENWGSRAGFVLAAIGSAVGLGNLWGFPYKVYSYGGGAFLVPYLLAMLLIGIPLMILEFSLGHMTQRAAPNAYRGINRKTEPVGWWGILLGFVIITYYPVILAWCGNYFYECVRSIATGEALPWSGEGLEGVKNAGKYFGETFLNQWTDADSPARPWSLGRLVTPILASLVVIWVLMYLCICRGVKLVSRVVLWTVPIPWAMLMILTIRGLTLPGAQEGMNFYLDPDWSKLADPETWRWGFGQMFFSMSLAFGVMITYASFLHRKSDINNNAAIIGLADIGTSFIAGLAVFATLGGMAYATAAAGAPVPLTEVVDGGPGLAFVAFPYALAQLPAAAWFGAIFFLALLLLGIDSAFSITESVLASLVDKTGWNRGWTLVGMSLVGLGAGVVYCTQGGLAWLGSIDEFINSTWGGIALLGLLECVVVGWGYRVKRLREHANERSDWRLGAWWDILIRYFAPIVLSALFAWSLLDKASDTGGFLYTQIDTDAGKQTVLNTPVLAGLVIAVAAPVLSLILSLVPSPGGNRHAAHRGQDVTGRMRGWAGTGLATAALVLLALGFLVSVRAGRDLNGSIEMIGMGKATAESAQAVHKEALDKPLPLLLGGACLAVVACVLGASVVASAESEGKRPSGAGRWSAGWGVVTLGGSAGLVLSSMLIPHRRAKAEQAYKGTQAAAGGVAAPPVEMTTELTPMSYLVLAGMITLLVIGLAACLFLAMRNSGTDEAQLAENGE